MLVKSKPTRGTKLYAPVADEASEQSHRRLLETDAEYAKAATVREVGNPLALVRELFTFLDKPLIPGSPKRKQGWWPTDATVFLGFYGSERVVGNALALFLPKLTCFKFDRIYMARITLAECRGLTKKWGVKQTRRLLEPWCLNCCKCPTASKRCPPGEHQWIPPLFFREKVKSPRRRYPVTYLCPNREAWDVLIKRTYLQWLDDTTKDETSPITTDQRVRLYLERCEQAAQARQALAENR